MMGTWMKIVSHKRLVELLSYDLATGIFLWKRDRKGGARAGQRAGCSRRDGRIMISVDGIDYRAHRLAWFYIHGFWPINEIDHIDGDVTNNSILNLREADRSQNQVNQIGRGVDKGIYLHQNGRWRVRVNFRGKTHNIGYFSSKNEAIKQRKMAALRIHGPFANIEDR